MSSVSTENHWKQFGKWLKQKRTEAGLTQVQVGDRAGITDVQYARIEKGESGTKRETVISLAHAIGINLVETLNKAGFDSPKTEAHSSGQTILLPDGLEPLDFDGLDQDDLKDIGDFIRFKKSQKKLSAAPADKGIEFNNQVPYSKSDRKEKNKG